MAEEKCLSMVEGLCTTRMDDSRVKELPYRLIHEDIFYLGYAGNRVPTG